MRRTAVAAITSACVLVASCTQTVRLPEPEYAHISASDAGTLRIHTVDDRHYQATRFSSTDSTLVIVDARRSSGVTGGRYEIDDPPRLPYELKWA